MALFSGLLVGFLIKTLLPANVTEFISFNLFDTVSTIFIRGMGFVVGPLVFFSIATSVMDFSDMKAFGRIGAKIIITYMCTTLIAVTLAYLSLTVIQPGDSSLLPFIEKMSQTSVSASMPAAFSLKDMIVDMVPKTFFGPFVESNMLQIIVIAVLFGLATNKLGEHSEGVVKFVKIGNSIFSNIISIIVKLLPLSVFCLMANLMISMDADVFGKIVIIEATGIVALLCMIVVYSLLLLFVGKVNPFKFWANHKDAILFAVSTCSSSATIPTSMRCLDRFGVSPKIYSFSIPLGATINMDGLSVTYAVLTLSMARIFGIEIGGAALISLFISIMFISMGTPGVANAGIAFQMLLLTQIGVPAATIAFLVPLHTIIEFFDTAINVCGDGVVTTIIARTEGLLNTEKKKAS